MASGEEYVVQRACFGIRDESLFDYMREWVGRNRLDSLALLRSGSKEWKKGKLATTAPEGQSQGSIMGK